MAHPDVLRAYDLIQAGTDLAQARGFCLRRVVDAPDDGEAWFLLGIVTRRGGQSAEALPFYGRASRLLPGYTAAYFNIGQIHYCLGQFRDAIGPYLRAQQDWPDDELIALSLGDCHAMIGDHEAAIVQYDRHQALKPSAVALVNKATSLRNLGRQQEAWTTFREAVQFDPGLESAWYGMGVLARLLRRPEAGTAALRRSIRLKPGSERAHYQMAGLFLAARAHGPALAASETALALAPDGFFQLCYRAEALEGLGRTAEAYAAFGRARRINVGYGLPETRRTVMRLREAFGAPVADPDKAPSGALGGMVTMATLGANGRYGNQLLQYGFLRLYAARHGLRYQVPEWMGTYMFDLVDPPVERMLPVVEETWGELEESLIAERPRVHADRDLEGYFCKSTRYMAGQRALFRRLFTPGRHLRPAVEAAMGRLRERGRTIVAIHLRRGDFGWGPFWVAPVAWYRTWLARLWPHLADPVLYVASDHAGMADAFSDYAPVTMDDIGGPIPHLGFYVDHYVLSRADVVGISNSTFSFTATMLNEAGTLFFRPHKERQEMVPYDPWDAEVLI